MTAIGLILGGGAGTRLQPLTSERSKPAVPVAGKYRLVDIPISNCINSDIRQIYVLTQFNSASLHRHIQSTYHFDQFSRGYVRLLAAEQTPSSNNWFQGTADAVRQCIPHFTRSEPELTIILSGDQLYRMNFRKVIEQHVQTKAAVTICTKPVPRREAGALGIMQVDDSKRIVQFAEKPGDTPALDVLRAPLYTDECYLASMGIYVFNTQVLLDMLNASEDSDFGKHIIPMAIENSPVYSYIYDGYWKDIGTIGMFWEANLALTVEQPEFTFYDHTAPIYTRMRFLPPSKINHCAVSRCLLTEGSIISGHRVQNSVVGLRAQVREGSVIEDSILMGADFYEFDCPDHSRVELGIGRNCFISKTIVDKNVRIGDGAHISPGGKPDQENELFIIKDGVMVIPKGTVIPPGTKL